MSCFLVIELLVMAKKPVIAKKPITPSTPVSPKDGLDNTGTQGYDSLSDDAYTGSSTKPDEHPNDDESHTGSSSEDFEDKSI